MRQGLRTVLAVALAVATVALAAGCGGSAAKTASSGAAPGAATSRRSSGPTGAGSAGSGAPSGAPVKVNIAWVAISGSQLPLWVTYEGGYFRKNGLDVKLNYVAGGASTMQALISGQDQFATFGDTEVVDANAQKIPVIAIASCVDRPLFQVIGAKGVTSFAQLRGKKIGVTQIGSVGYYVIEKAMAANHFGSSDATLFQIPAQPDLLSAVTSGSVQAAVLVPPFTLRAVASGLKVLYDPARHGIWGAMSNLNTTGAYIKQHPGIVQKVIDAYVEGSKRTVDDPAFAIKVFEHFSKQNAAVARRVYQTFKPYYASPPLKNIKALQAMIGFVAQTDPKAAHLSAAAMMDMRFVEKAAA